MTYDYTYWELVPAGGPRPPGARRKRRASVGSEAFDGGVGRRGFVAGAAAGATAVGVTSLGIFPAAREAAAHHDPGHYGYRIRGLPCPSYASSHNCDPGCGPSQALGDYCVTSGQYTGWFRNGGNYRLRPGACASGADGWAWRYDGACGSCATMVEYRCHDGFALIGGSWQPKVCRWATQCVSNFHPQGHVDLVQCSGGNVRVAGWALDRNTRAAIRVHVYENDEGRRSLWADDHRADVGRAFPSAGPNHGFDVTFGTHTRRGRKTKVCVYGINAGPGRNKRIGCRYDRCT